MVEEHIGTARRIGRGIVADHRIKAERGLHRFAFKPAVEQGARRLGEQVQHIALPFERETRQLAPLQGGVDQGLDATTKVRRCFHREITQYVGHHFQRVIVSRQHIGIMLGEAPELSLRPLQPAAKLQIPTIFLRQEVGDWPFNDAIAFGLQLHVADDLRLQQADRVAGDRVAEAGVEFFRHRSATDDIAALDNADLQPGLSKVERTDKAIMARADDDGIIFLGH